MIHLDTVTVIAYLNGNRTVAERLHGAVPEVAISALVLAELLYGVNLSIRTTDNRAKIVRLQGITPAIPFDSACAEAYAEIKSELRRIGKPTGEVDALIAATAIVHDAILVTQNRRHFENIPRLKLENWLA